MFSYQARPVHWEVVGETLYCWVAGDVGVSVRTRLLLPESSLSDDPVGQ